MQKFSSFGRKKKKQTKIRHRMDMPEDLQLLQISFGYYFDVIGYHGNKKSSEIHPLFLL